MKAIKAILLCTAFLFICSVGHAQTGDQFLYLSIFDQAKVLKPIIARFIAGGYHHVPDWVKLADECEIQIKRWDMGGKDINEIALEAAKQRGMTKWKW